MLATVIASLTWMIAMTKFKLNEAYPFIGLNFVGILLLSSWFLGETITPQKIIGVALIVLGLVVSHV